MITQFSQKAGNATNCNYFPVPSVLRLLKGVLPFAIGFAIALVVVNSTKSFVCWSDPHVGQEIGEFIPSGINQDAPATIVGVANIVWVEATLPHVTPRFKSGCLAHSVNLVSAFYASFGSTGFKGRITADCFIPTITKAVAVIFSVGSFNHKKLAEPLPDDGFSFLWHNIADSLLCFCGGSGYRSPDSLHLHHETRHSVFKG